jgi:hypothetical protein
MRLENEGMVRFPELIVEVYEEPVDTESSTMIRETLVPRRYDGLYGWYRGIYRSMEFRNLGSFRSKDTLVKLHNVGDAGDCTNRHARSLYIG